MRDRDLYGKQLNETTARYIVTDSERLFATTFLSWFGRKIPLIFQPGPIRIPGLGTTCPDFLTPMGRQDHLIYEVTLTRNTWDNDRKAGQYEILNAHHKNNPQDFHLEINGNTLKCPDFMMETLEKVYQYQLKVYEAQRVFNRLGRDYTFYLSVCARAMI